jgi:DNA-binding NtrC family response regulator
MSSSARVLLVGADETRFDSLHELLTSAGHLVERGRLGADGAHGDGGDAVDVVVVPDDSRESQLHCELAMLRARVGDGVQRALVGRSSAIAHVRELVGRAAASRLPVVVTGEAGVGKHVVARLVHDLSKRAAGPFVTVRCTGADVNSLEHELFGRAVDGAREGALELARGGTLVLDDATALPLALRARLAEAATSGAAGGVEGPHTPRVDVRLVLVARQDRSVADISSSEILIRSFNAMVIHVPPLRERRSDIPPLVQHFRQSFAAACGCELAPLVMEEMLPLLGREWPGNVRELEQWVERQGLGTRAAPSRAEGDAWSGIELGQANATLEQLERAYILHVLAMESGHQSRTAARLGIDRRTLYRKLKQYRST